MFNDSQLLVYRFHLSVEVQLWIFPFLKGKINERFFEYYKWFFYLLSVHFLIQVIYFFHSQDIWRRGDWFILKSIHLGSSSKILVSLGSIFKVKSSKESSMVKSLIVSFKVKYTMKSIKEFIKVSIIGSWILVWVGALGVVTF